MNINEDAPVTTTDNAGGGLVDPKLPIAKDNMFRRVKQLSDKKKKLVEDPV